MLADSLEIGSYPQPTFLDREWFQRFEKNRLSDSAQTGKHYVLEDGLLPEESSEFPLFRPPASKVGWLMPGSRPKWIR